MAKSSLLVLTLLFLALKTNLSVDSPGRFLSTCEPSDYLHSGSDYDCDTSDGAECCKAGESYPLYSCSPDSNEAILTLNNFEKNGDGGAEAECDGVYHSNDDLVVALSTGWFDNKSRCGKMIKITSNGQSVLAKVVDKCDSEDGCNSDHGFQPPCANNHVDGSRAVWEALGLNKDDGEVKVSWSDASS